jgi:hypothetical protein
MAREIERLSSAKVRHAKLGMHGGHSGLVEPPVQHRGGAAQPGDHHSAPFDVGQPLLCRPFDRRA